MGYYEQKGMEAGERARERIANGEKPVVVNTQELGMALGVAVVGGLATAAATVAAPVLVPAAIAYWLLKGKDPR